MEPCTKQYAVSWVPYTFDSFIVAYGNPWISTRRYRLYCCNNSLLIHNSATEDLVTCPTIANLQSVSVWITVRYFRVQDRSDWCFVAVS